MSDNAPALRDDPAYAAALADCARADREDEVARLRAAVGVLAEALERLTEVYEQDQEPDFVGAAQRPEWLRAALSLVRPDCGGREATVHEWLRDNLIRVATAARLEIAEGTPGCADFARRVEEVLASLPPVRLPDIAAGVEAVRDECAKAQCPRCRAGEHVELRRRQPDKQVLLTHVDDAGRPTRYCEADGLRRTLSHAALVAAFRRGAGLDVPRYAEPGEDAP